MGKNGYKYEGCEDKCKKKRHLKMLKHTRRNMKRKPCSAKVWSSTHLHIYERILSELKRW